MTKKLDIGPELKFPLDAVTSTFALFGKRGSGKTNGATVIVEELVKANLPACILDPVDAWWGLKSSFDGKSAGLPIYIFGGEHADLPLEPTAGAFIAELLATERIPMILSMKRWGVAERARFVSDFARQLLQVNREPLMIVLEEADAFIPQKPQKGEEAMLGNMDRLVRWGRQSGIGCTLVTQRSAKVNKDVTTQAETLVAFRTTGPQDRDAIDNWIKYHAGEERRHEVMSTLATLPSGTAWVWSPEWLEMLAQVQFRRRETYDSAATPKVGEKRPAPKRLADVDIERLKGQMADAIEHAKASDPRELQKRVKELETDLKRLKAHPTEIPQHVIDDIVRKEVERRMATVAKEIGHRFASIRKTIAIAAETIEATASDVALKQLGLDVVAAPGMPRPFVTTTRSNSVTTPPAARKVVAMQRVSPSASEYASGNGEITPQAQKFLNVAATMGKPLTTTQLAVLAGYSAKSGGTAGALAVLRREQLMTGPSSALELTDAGRARAVPEDLPRGRALLDYWISHQAMTPQAGEFLRAIYNAHPQGISTAAIAEACGYSAKSGGTAGALALLRKLELIEGKSDALTASEVFFQ